MSLMALFFLIASHTNTINPEFVKDNNQFALNLYQSLSSDENLILSPYSLSSALAMTYAGAKGKTAQEMQKTLYFYMEDIHNQFFNLQKVLNSSQQHITLKIANALWPQQDYPFLKSYLQLMQKYYDTNITALDYKKDYQQARLTINQWVEKQTQEKIKNLIPEGTLNPLVRLVLTNAIYFKGNWAYQFKEEQTQERTFYLLDNSTIQTPIMHISEKFNYTEDENTQVIELPYQGEEYSMLVFLPKEKNGIKTLEKNLTLKQIQAWQQQLFKQKVYVYLPKFKFSFAVQLNEALQNLGIKQAFNQDKADFSGMDGKAPWLYIGAVLHKAFIEVNEEGTEAAGASAVVMMERTAVMMKNIVFNANHPFMFVILHKETGSILFIGKVMQPVI